MSKSKSSPRVFSREFKLGIIRRILAGENVSAIGRKVRLSRKDLYAWRDRFLQGGPEALRGRGRPRRTLPNAPAASETVSVPLQSPTEELEAAHERIAELERKIGQQQVELDFFRQALRRVEEGRRGNAEPGGPPSTRSSKR